jgi:hypothetical protein
MVVENKNVEKIKSLPKGVLYDLQKTLDIIETFLIIKKPKPYYDDCFFKERFTSKGVDEMAVIKILNLLDDEFGIINFQQRSAGNGVSLGLKNDEDAKDFQEFYKLVREIYSHPGTIEKIYILKKNNNYSKAIINDDYFHPIRISKTNYWDLLIKLAEKQTVEKSFYKNGYDQLVNKSKFPFKDNEYAQIVRSEGKMIYSLIDIRFIDQNEFEKGEKNSNI